MADRTVGAILIGTADIVQVSRCFQHHRVGMFFGADAQTQAVDPQAVFPIVAAARLSKRLPGRVPQRCDGGGRIRDSSARDMWMPLCQRGSSDLMGCLIMLRDNGASRIRFSGIVQAGLQSQIQNDLLATLRPPAPSKLVENPGSATQDALRTSEGPFAALFDEIQTTSLHSCDNLLTLKNHYEKVLARTTFFLTQVKELYFMWSNVDLNGD